MQTMDLDRGAESLSVVHPVQESRNARMPQVEDALPSDSVLHDKQHQQGDLIEVLNEIGLPECAGTLTRYGIHSVDDICGGIIAEEDIARDLVDMGLAELQIR